MFTPLGEVSRRNKVIDAIAAHEPGEVVLYEELQELLDVDRPTVQGIVNKSKHGLQKAHNRSVVAVPNIGYRILHPREHLHLAEVHQKKGRGQTRRSRSAVVHTDYATLTDVERVKFDTAAAILRAFQRFERRADLRYASRERVDAFIAEQSTKNDRTDSEVGEIMDRLARLEALMSGRQV